MLTPAVERSQMTHGERIMEATRETLRIWRNHDDEPVDSHSVAHDV